MNIPIAIRLQGYEAWMIKKRKESRHCAYLAELALHRKGHWRTQD
jgi:hypothetical protein